MLKVASIFRTVLEMFLLGIESIFSLSDFNLSDLVLAKT
jgi:hypothetical protein